MTIQITPYPTGGEEVSGIVTISWTPAIDSWHDDIDILYNIHYSNDNGSIWVQLETGLLTTSYNWNTTDTENGLYSIKIEAVSSDGLLFETIIDAAINIKHNIPSTTTSISSQNTNASFISFVGFQIILLALIPLAIYYRKRT